MKVPLLCPPVPDARTGVFATILDPRRVDVSELAILAYANPVTELVASPHERGFLVRCTFEDR
jgi:hypothetical protein